MLLVTTDVICDDQCDVYVELQGIIKDKVLVCVLQEPEENPSGVARAEPFIGRKANEMFSFLLSQYRIKPEFDASLATKEEEMVHKSQRSGVIA